MNPTPVSIRTGLLALPAAALLFVAAILMRGQTIDPALAPDRFAASISSPGAPLAWSLILAGMILTIYGLWAIHALLERGPRQRLALPGFLLSVLGIVTVLPYIGFLALGAPVVGRLYLTGQVEVMEVATAMASSTPALLLTSISGVAYIVGALLLALALRGRMPRALRVAFALQAPLLSIVALFSVAAELAGAVLLLAAGGWLAWQGWTRAMPAPEPAPALPTSAAS